MIISCFSSSSSSLDLPPRPRPRSISFVSPPAEETIKRMHGGAEGKIYALGVQIEFLSTSSPSSLRFHLSRAFRIHHTPPPRLLLNSVFARAEDFFLLRLIHLLRSDSILEAALHGFYAQRGGKWMHRYALCYSRHLDG